MSIAQQNEITELKRRVSDLEDRLQRLETRERNTMAGTVRKILTLPEKRKSA